MPVGAITSIAHRATGVLLFLILPPVVFLLELSVRNPEGFERAKTILQTPVIRLAGILVAWAFLHHLLAGIRFLLIDVEIGVEREQARRSAWLVNLGAPLILLVLLGFLV